MRRGYEPVEEYAPGNEDYDYDEMVQRQLDDETEARQFCCPECGGEIGVQTWLAHECSVGCDTSQRYCTECEWKGDPE